MINATLNPATTPTLDQIPCTTLKGVGPRISARLQNLGIVTLQDLLFHLPFRYQDRTHITPIGTLQPGDPAVIEGVIELTQLVTTKRRSLLCCLSDGSGVVTLRFFYFSFLQQQQLSQRGARMRCFGEVRRGKSGLELIHPEYRLINENVSIPIDQYLTPIYHTTEGLHQIVVRKLTDQALELLEKNPLLLKDYLPPNLLQQFQLLSLLEALLYVHRPPPDAPQNLLEAGIHPAQQRLAFEELLAHQLSLKRLREQIKQQTAPLLKEKKELTLRFINKLPFTLTTAQQRVVKEIDQDLQQTIPMLRLVQGDVGSGKTIVAALAALRVIENGYQVALMVPTEILAEQHFYNFFQWLSPLQIKVLSLVGRFKGKNRTDILESIAVGEAKLIVGTHALFQQDVKFSNLALIIVDEQHRFGVHQRLSLREKGVKNIYSPHQLIMTATPIPRTLAMTAYADLDCSIVDELPPGRTPVITIVVSNQRRDEIIKRVEQNCVEGKQAYWVCTLIEESEVMQCQAAQVTYSYLLSLLPKLRIGLIHGQLKTSEKEYVINAFKNHQLDLLVATTVIEVGVDIPNASLMIIENPERLGLAQLHQLRGRVGRGSAQSHCVLMYQQPLSLMAKQRLQIMRNTNDGFEIAQRDLEIRGPGEVLGTRQTGLMQFKIANLLRDQKLLEQVQQASHILLKCQHSTASLIRRWLGKNEHYGQV